MYTLTSGCVNGSFQKRSTLPPRRKFLPSGGGGETKLFQIIVNVLGHPKEVGGLTSNFLRGGGMDVFWNDPISRFGTSIFKVPHMFHKNGFQLF